ncbi:CXCR3 protein, partial [Amia calva]|nr:CXCR3 protein [Amia calva]
MTFDGADFIDYFSNNSNYSDAFYNYSYSDNCCAGGDVCTHEESLKFDALFLPPLYAVVLVLGLLGNGLVLAVLCRCRQSRSVTDMFVLNLALADTLLVITLPLWAVQAVQGWIFGTPMCKIVGVLFKMNFFCGIFLLACISLDRYLSIVHAVQMYSRRRPFGVRASCLAVWLLCGILCLPELVFLEAVSDKRLGGRMDCTNNYIKVVGKENMASWRLASRLLYHLAGFLLPSAIMAYCYARILVTLSRTQGTQRHRAVRVIMAIVVTFFFCWTPYNLTLLVDTLQTRGNLTDSCGGRTALDVSLVATTSLGYLHCCLNPLLYAFVGVKFRRNLLELLSTLGCHVKGQIGGPGGQARRGTPRARGGSLWSESSANTSYTSAVFGDEGRGRGLESM